MTPEETIEGINNLIREVKKLVPKVELYSANEMFNTLSVRVFNKKRNTAGRSLGKYKTSKDGKASSWQRKRFLAKRPTQNIDLNFTGNLFVSFTRGKENGHWVVGFKDGAEISLDNYSPNSRKPKGRKSKAKVQKRRPRKLRSDAQRATFKPMKQPKPIVYPGTAKLSELIEENLDMVIFSPNKTEVNFVLKNTNTFALDELTNLVNKHLK